MSIAWPQGRPPLPLHALRVLDLSSLLPGPFAGQLLADLGAAVVKVERPGGDPMRHVGTGAHGLLNAGKTIREIDLKSSEGLEEALALAAEADVVLESFRPGVLDRLGLGLERLREVSPGVVVVSLSGFGQTGPAADEPGHNGTYLARAGAAALATPLGAAPADRDPYAVADLGAGLYAVVAALAATRTPRGVREAVHLDVSLYASALALLAPRLAEHAAADDERRRDLLRRPAHGAFRAADGRYVVVAAVEDHFWRRTCAVLGLHDLAARADLATYASRFAHAEEVDERLGERLAEKTAEEWVTLLRAADVPVALVQTPEEAVADPAARHLDAFPRYPQVDSFQPIQGWPA